MRVIAFVNNRVGAGVVRHIAESEPGRLVGLVIHPPSKRKWGDAILETAGLDEDQVFLGDELGSDVTTSRLAALDPDLGLSAYFKYILGPTTLDLFPEGCINLHPSYLPFNRGVYTNVWSIVDETPAGASLHYMVEKVDAGPVIARTEVPVSPTDTGRSLYRKLEGACVDLFCDTWEDIVVGRASAEDQDLDQGTAHRLEDVEEIDEIDLDESYHARELVNRLRARTFPPYEGCYFTVDGRKVFMRLNLWWEEEYPPESLDGTHEDEL